MKKVMITLIVLFLLSCTEKQTAMQKFREIDNQFTKGTWRVTNCTKEGQQNKREYSGFSFSFMGDNRIMVVSSLGNYTGKWSVVRKEGTDDEPPTDTYFVISFSNPEILESLNGKWMVVERERSYLSLAQPNATYDGTDYLAFEKK